MLQVSLLCDMRQVKNGLKLLMSQLHSDKAHPEVGQAEPEDGKEPDQFHHIAAEIRRQIDVINSTSDSLDTKISIILGFIFLVLSQIVLRAEIVNAVTSSTIVLIVFSVGLIIIAFSIFSGWRAYYINDYWIGPKISDLITQYKEFGNARDFNQVISSKISEAIEYNTKVGDKKATHAQRMMISFIFGFAIILVLEMACIIRI